MHEALTISRLLSVVIAVVFGLALTKEGILACNLDLFRLLAVEGCSSQVSCSFLCVTDACKVYLINSKVAETKRVACTNEVVLSLLLFLVSNVTSAVTLLLVGLFGSAIVSD